ncbi:MAG TPA: malto-oligosyltrehalose trehalohydrolase [Syntrophorhabdaceae bacterium]
MKEYEWQLDIGASVVNKGVRFRVWVPEAKKVTVKLFTEAGPREIDLSREEWGYHGGLAEGVREQDRYFYVIDGISERPDPASRFQPEGVHGPSQVIDPSAYQWQDRDWKGRQLKDFIIYEIHIGTFTQEGTFEAAIGYLDYMKELGITAIEIMPVTQFPGERNWGYDGVFPFAPQNSYGGPWALKKLVDACHRKGLAVIFDVVYNHLGPEGNYLRTFAVDYFTDRYNTPWGDAVNYDGPLSDQVRHYFISNALYWLSEYHGDALRLDAIQGIYDLSAHHVLMELAEAVDCFKKASGNEVALIAESDLNDVRVINPWEKGGYGLDAVWNDDFHHSLHTLITHDQRTYYKDFGALSQMAKALEEGFVYSGQHSPHRRRRHGNSSKEMPANQFVVCSQNHDQVGNTQVRPGAVESLEELKLRAAMVLLSPYIPLLFMGEEYGEKAPFYYFTSFFDPALSEAVRKSKDEEVATLWGMEAPDPEAEKTFLDAKIHLDGPRSPSENRLYDFYRTLIKLRKEVPVLARPVKEQAEIRVFEKEKTLIMRRWIRDSTAFLVFNFNEDNVAVELTLPPGKWEKILDSSAPEWGGDGSRAPKVLDFEDGKALIEAGRTSASLYVLTDVRV